MTPGVEKSIAQRQRERANGMVFARMWRKFYSYGTVDGQLCGRCDGTTTVWWFGRPGEGGRKGPCPRCRVEAAAQFRKQHRQEIFGGL